MKNQMQEDFERYITDDGAHPAAAAKDAKGEYNLVQSAGAWAVWQSATKRSYASEALTLSKTDTENLDQFYFLSKTGKPSDMATGRLERLRQLGLIMQNGKADYALTVFGYHTLGL